MQFKHFSAIDIMSITMWVSFSALNTWISGPRCENLPAPPTCTARLHKMNDYFSAKELASG